MKRLPRNPSLAYTYRHYWMFLALAVVASTVAVWMVTE